MKTLLKWMILTAVVIWSLIAWVLYLIVDAGDDWLTRNQISLPISEEWLAWLTQALSGLAGGLAGIGEVLVILLWIVGLILIAIGGAIATLSVPMLQQIWQSVTDTGSPVSVNPMSADNSGPPPPPSGNVFEVKPTRVVKE